MILVKNTSINETYRKPHILNQKEYKKVSEYIKETVKNWIEDSDTFTVRDLFGYQNADWRLTPLQIIYDNYLIKYKNNEEMAYIQSGIALGHIVKCVVNELSEKFYIERDIERDTIHYYFVK